MSRFNICNNVSTYDATTHEGGRSVTKDADAMLAQFIVGSFLGERFYESVDSQTKRFVGILRDAAETRGAAFIAKVALWSRQSLGMRTVPQLAAAFVNSLQFDGKRRFYASFFHRPDDVAEVFAAIDTLGGKRSHALVNGARDYMEHVGEYQLDKYKMLGKKYNIYDIVNLTHANSDAIDKLKRDELGHADTWETAISNASTNEERESEWLRLVKERKLGYLALLLNLRNITKCDGCDEDFIKEYLVPQLTDETAIRKSLVFPYQIFCAASNASTAYHTSMTSLVNPHLLAALSDAFKMSVSNVPDMTGDRVAMLIDVSGSMDSAISTNSSLSIKQVSACYAVAVALRCKDATIVKFGDRAKMFKLDKSANVFGEIDRLCRNDGCGFGTNVNSTRSLLYGGYDRLFIFSDMQVMDAHTGWLNGVAKYKYSFDLGYYSTSVLDFSKKDTFELTSLSDKVLSAIPLLESGKGIRGVLDAIDKVSLF